MADLFGKTKIEGTTYDVTGGITLINGVAHPITIGKTLKDGTVYEINKKHTFEDLLQSATIITTIGNNSEEAVATGPLYLTSAPASGAAYLFSMHYGNIAIYKISNRVITQTALTYCGTPGTNGFSGIYYNTSKKGFYNYPYMYTSGTGTGSLNFGATLSLLTFSYSDAIVDDILSNLTLSRKAGTGLYTGETGYVSRLSTTDKSNLIYIVFYDDRFDFWKVNGSTYTKIFGTTLSAGQVYQTSTLRTGTTVYSGGITGFI